MAGEQKSGDRLKLFVSYSRRDMAAADALVAAPEAEGFEVTIDRRDLPYGEQWQEELADFIRGSDTVVWLVSPDSVTSKWCNWELGEVGRLNKRLVPVRIREVAPERLPESLGKVHLLPAEGAYVPASHLSILATTLNTDRGWVKEATRLADRAREWIARDRSSALLLRGPALKNAETWSTQQPKAAPAPSSEVLELILSSRRGAARRQRYWLGGATAVALGAFALALYAFQQRSVAISERDAALTTQSRFLNGQARQEYANGDYGTAVALALEALPDPRRGSIRPYLPEAEAMLYQAVMALREQRILGAADPGGFSDAKFSSDGARVFTLSFSYVARLWDARTGNEIAQLGDNILAGKFSRDGKWLVAVKSDRTVGIWDAADGRPLHAFQADDVMSSARFSHDATHIVATVAVSARSFPRCPPWESGTFPCFSGTGARVWNVADATTLKLPDEVRSAAFSPDGRQLVTAMDDGTAQVWDQARQAPLSVLNRESPRDDLDDRIASAVFSPDGKYILTTQLGRKQAWLWDAHTSARIARLEGSEGVAHAAFSANGDRIVTVGPRTVQVWQTAEPATSIESPASESDIRSATLSHDGQRVVWASHDNIVRMWVVARGEDITVVGRHREPVRTAEFSNDGRLILTSSEDGTARIWDGTESGAVQTLRGHAGEIIAAAFTASGEIVTASSDDTVRTWNATTGALLATKPIEPHRAVGFSASGRRLVTASRDNVVRVWDLAGDAPPLELHGYAGGGESVAISADERKVVASGGEGTAQLWDVASRGPPIGLAKLPADTIFVGFSRDGKRVVSGTHPEARIWNVADGKPIKTFGRGQAINGIDFSPDGRLLVAASVLRKVQAFDANTLDERRAWQTSAPLVGVAVSPDSKRVVAVGYGPPQIWDIARGEEVAVLKGDPRQLFLLASFSRDGRRVLVASRERAWVWPAFPSTQDLVDHARAVMPRPLAADQRRRYFLDPASAAAAEPPSTR
jgi:WD40 repeat protein